MKKLFPILLGLIVGLAYSTTVDAQSSITYADGKYLQFAHPTSDSIVSQKPIFPTYGSVTTTAVADGADTVYLNNFYNVITLEDVIDSDYELTVVAAPYLTIGAQALITVEADADGRAFTLTGDAAGYVSAGDTALYLNLFFNGSNFLLNGSALAE